MILTLYEQDGSFSILIIAFCVTNIGSRVQIKEIRGEATVNDAQSRSAVVESKNFRWQQKMFGRWEKDFYKDKGNCVTDLDCSYHEKVCKILGGDDSLYSYVNDDEFCQHEEVLYIKKNHGLNLKKMPIFYSQS